MVILCELRKHTFSHILSTLKRCENFKKRNSSHWIVDDFEIARTIIMGHLDSINRTQDDSEKSDLEDELIEDLIELDQLFTNIEDKL